MKEQPFTASGRDNMKSLLIFLSIFVSNSAFTNACRNTVPMSEAIRYHEAAKLGEGVPALYTCQDKPEEPCLCFDQCEGWDVCEVKDVEETIESERGEPETIVVKKLVNNIELMQARRARMDIEANHREIEQAKKLQAKQTLQELEFKGTTVLQLRQELQAFKDNVAELLK